MHLPHRELNLVIAGDDDTARIAPRLLRESKCRMVVEAIDNYMKRQPA
jgi:hypothetical protein